MKLLTWMHRKFRQGSSETLKEFHLGQPLLDDMHQYQKQNQANGAQRQGHVERQRRKSFADLEDKPTTDYSEYFEGFLAIGTLGTEAFITEPETPTFAASFEKLAEGQTEVTVNELRLLNDELERVLAAETRDDGWTDSSGRNSHVSNGRISHASTITLSGKSLEISETTGTGNSVCPLQEYLLGSAMEFPERPTMPKKESRTSLGDLIERHKAEEITEPKHKRGDKKDDKEGHKTAMNLIKKILKNRKILHAASKNSSTTREPNESSSAESSTTREPNESSSAETKLVKILQKFQKKVHPECLISTQKSDKLHKIGIKDMIPCGAGHYKDRHTFPDENTTLSQQAHRNGHMRISKSRSIPHQFSEDGDDSNGSRECWIKTDADFLVLEL